MTLSEVLYFQKSAQFLLAPFEKEDKDKSTIHLSGQSYALVHSFCFISNT